MNASARYVFLLLESFSHLAFSCVLEPLRIANLVSGQPLYHWSLISESGSSATSSSGVVTLVGGGLEPLERSDHLFLISGYAVQHKTTPGVLNYLRREREHGVPIGAICSGAYVLARAGFLDGVKAAIHWEFHDLFSEEFPAVRLVRNVFVADEKFMTASGGTAAADLMLHLIARDHGSALSTAVADQMVYNAVREGSAAQRVSLQSRHGMRNAHLVRAIQIMEKTIEAPLAPREIAAELGISVRQLERLFGKYLNTSPKRYFLEMRLQRARNLIVQTDYPVTQIAVACGFSSTSYFSRLFRNRFGISPLSHRSTLT